MTKRTHPHEAEPGGAPPPVPCEKIQKALFAYLAHELGDKQSWLVHEHLLGCEGCAREAARLAKTVELLRGSGTVAAPERLPPSVRRRLERALLHPALDWIYVHRRLTAWVTALLAVAALVAIAYFCQLRPETVIYWLK